MFLFLTLETRCDGFLKTFSFCIECGGSLYGDRPLCQELPRDVTLDHAFFRAISAVIRVHRLSRQYDREVSMRGFIARLVTKVYFFRQQCVRGILQNTGRCVPTKVQSYPARCADGSFMYRFNCERYHVMLPTSVE